MPVKRLRKFLQDNHVSFGTIPHPLAYTAAETAHSAHIPGKTMAKTVMVILDEKEMVMVVLPASYRVYPELLRDAVHAESIELATENQFRAMFPGCDLGAMPPFGNLYGMRVFAAQSLTEDREIAFNAGTHSELVHMSWEDYQRLVNPTILTLSCKDIPVRPFPRQELTFS